MTNEPSGVIDMLPGLVWTALSNGRVDYVNRAWCEYTGMHPDEALGEGWQAGVHPDDLTDLRRRWSAILAAGAADEMPARLRRFDGDYLPFVLRVRPLRDADGTITTWCGLNIRAADADAPPVGSSGTADIRRIADSMPCSVVVTTPSGEVEYANPHMVTRLGLSLDQQRHWRNGGATHPDDLAGVVAGWTHSVATGQPFEREFRQRRADGVYRWVHVRGLPLRDDEGRIARWFVIDEDIHDSRLSGVLFAGEARLLEMVVRHVPPDEILDAFCRLVEEVVDGSRCSIMLAAPCGTRMEHVRGPSLPPGFIAAVAGANPSRDTGPCPQATARGEQVMSPDFAQEQRWQANRWPAMAMSHGLRSCWSTPIVGASGKVLGVFAIYGDVPRSPTPDELAVTEQLAHIAGNATERLRAQVSLARALDKLRASEEWLKSIIDTMPGSVWTALPDGHIDYTSQYWYDYTGLSHDQTLGTGWLSVVHPDDVEGMVQHWRTHMVPTGTDNACEIRLRRRDGAYHWFLIRAAAQRDPHTGEAVRWYGAAMDIEERKRTELLHASEKQLLEDVAGDRSSEDILAAFCLLVESLLSGSRCRAMLVDENGQRIEHVAGPSMPAGFAPPWIGAVLGIETGPCAMAACLGERIVAADLAVEQRWRAHDWPDVALSLGLRACWSTPFTSASGKVLGVFTIYHDHPCAPSPDDLTTIERLAHIAGTVADRLQSRQSLARALEEVRASEARVTSIINAVHGSIWITDPNGGLLFLNQYWYDYSGLTEEESLGHAWISALHPDDVDRLVPYLRNMLATRQAGEYEARVRRFDGAYRWLLLRAVPQCDDSGQVVRWYGASVDIDERKRAEILLEGEKQLLGMMADRKPLPSILGKVCQLAEATREGALCGIVLVAHWRDGKARHGDAGVPSLQLGATGGVPEDLLSPGDAQPLDIDADPMAMAALRNEPVASPDLAREPRWPAWRARAREYGIQANWSLPIVSTDGSVAAVFSVMYRQAGALESLPQDFLPRFMHLANAAISRARSDAALRQSEAFFARAQQLSHTGTFSWKTATDEMSWSDEVYRIIEIDPSLRPSFDLVYTRVHPEDLPSHVEMMRRQRQLGSDFEYEHRMLFPDGRTKWVRLAAHASRDEDGEVEYIVALQDVTQRHLSEKALGTVRSELAHVSRVASMGALTASIAHEVNQPLAGIITNASTCLRMLAATPPNVDGAAETARRTIRDGHRASEVIQRLRSMFAKKPAASEPLDLGEAAREVIAMLQVELQRGGITVHPEFADHLPAVRGDRVQLQQVILNLVMNAADAMSGITGRARHLVLRTSSEDDGSVRLDVRDEGVGFSEQDVGTLFNAFYTTKNHGMGIGLSVSKAIIENHQGRLWASANDGPGATFSFSIPGNAPVDDSKEAS